MGGLPSIAGTALAEFIRRHRAHDTVPVPVIDIAEREGWEIEFRSDLGKIRGISGVYRGVKLMWINALLPLEEQRAVVAHELGHWLNGDQRVIELCQHGSFAYLWDRKLERQATLTGACLLVPSWAIREYQTIEAIAAACAVPPWLVKMRLGLV
uniref:ImmA/IrrE family metallo-endopeptidase n=2 Tax=Thermorudis TaxID=1649508 RepID=A0A7C2WJ70_9BACT